MEGGLRHAIIQATLDAAHNAKTARDRAAAKKGARDLVTETDKRNEQLIVRAVRNVDPLISVWGEEYGKDSRGPSRLLVIDPLDATTNFARKIELYSIMVALFEEGVPKLGIVHLPETGEMFLAEAGKGTRIDGRRIQVTQRRELSDAVISVNRSNYPEDLIPAGLSVIELLMRNALSWRNFGTAGVEYAYVASGKLDGVVTPLAEAVHAAGYLIMQEAGAKVTDHRGRPISLESETVVAANPELHEQLVDLVKDAF